MTPSVLERGLMLYIDPPSMRTPYVCWSAREPEKDGGGTTLLLMKAEAVISSSCSSGRSVGANALVACTTFFVVWSRPWV